MHLHLIHLFPLLLAKLGALSFLAVFGVMTPPSPSLVGSYSTLVWGTAPGGTAIASELTGMVVTSIKITPRNAGPIGTVENPDGAQLERIYLDDGFDAEIEGVFNSAVTYPVAASAATLTIPAAAKVDFSNNVLKTVFPVTVESNGLTFERKGNAMISFKIAHSPGVEGVAS